MNPLIVESILETIYKLGREKLKKPKIGEAKAIRGVVGLIDHIAPYMSVRQHRKHDAKIRKLKRLIGE